MLLFYLIAHFCSFSCGSERYDNQRSVIMLLNRVLYIGYIFLYLYYLPEEVNLANTLWPQRTAFARSAIIPPKSNRLG